MTAKAKLLSVEFRNALNVYLEHIRADYAKWGGNLDNRDEFVKKFNESLHYTNGNKYVKVMSEDRVHSFIVCQDTGKFKAGDILKAATWAAPATNFSRGNILDGIFARVTWTGAL